MKKFTSFKGSVIPLDRDNIDTDAIIPKQYLKSVNRTGFGINLFDEWRYLDKGEPGMNQSNRPLNPDFIFNDEAYKNSRILLSRKNFGCGSSREHAAWAIADYGIRVIIAESFAEIFYNNCFKNGVLPIVLSASEVDLFIKSSLKGANLVLEINLETQNIKLQNDKRISFKVDEYRKEALIAGLDEIGQTLEKKEKIREFEKHHKKEKPWLFLDIGADNG